MKDSYKKYLLLGLVFCLGFALAMLLGRSSPVPQDKLAASAAPIDSAKLAEFLDSANRGDYEAMKKQGDAIFRQGATVPDSRKRFKDYLANSYPPYTVFAFYSEGSDTRVRRVLLTLDEKERVESFLAEEMTVSQ